jgi:hypothetical protein
MNNMQKEVLIFAMVISVIFVFTLMGVTLADYFNKG